MTQTWRWWVVIWGAAAVVLYALSSVLLPFVTGMVVAYFLNPLVQRLQRWGISRTVGTLLMMLAFFTLSGLLLAALLPRIEAEVSDTLSHLPEYRQSLELRFGPLVHKLMGKLSPADLSRLQDGLSAQAGTVAGWALSLVSGVVRGGLALMDILSLVFIMPIVTFYLLRDWDVLVAKVDAWLPQDQAPVIRGRLQEIDQTLSAFVRGQALVCLVLGCYYGISLSVAGIDLGLVIGIVAGLLSCVPYLGMLTGLLVALGMAFAQTGDWLLPAIVGAIFAVGHLTESNVLTPRLVGDRIGLHPLWIMFALMSGGALMGFVGLLLAVPVAAVIGVLLRYTMERYLDSPLYLGGKGS